MLHDTKLDTSHNVKLKKKWKGPYIVIDKYPERNAYRLAELDGSPLKEPVQAGSRLKYFYRREDHPALISTPEPPDAASNTPEEMIEEHREDPGNQTSKEYEMRDIVGERTIGGQLQYLVQWIGYDQKTWEPIENLEGCPELIDAFKKRKRQKNERQKKRQARRRRA